jgi:hypothetical protein
MTRFDWFPRRQQEPASEAIEYPGGPPGAYGLVSEPRNQHHKKGGERDVAGKKHFALILNRPETRLLHAHLLASVLYLRWQEIQPLSGRPMLETLKNIGNFLHDLLTQKRRLIVLIVNLQERQIVWQTLTLLRQYYQQALPSGMSQTALDGLNACCELLRQATPFQLLPRKDSDAMTPPFTQEAKQPQPDAATDPHSWIELILFCHPENAKSLSEHWENQNPALPWQAIKYGRSRGVMQQGLVFLTWRKGEVSPILLNYLRRDPEISDFFLQTGAPSRRAPVAQNQGERSIGGEEPAER